MKSFKDFISEDNLDELDTETYKNYVKKASLSASNTVSKTGEKLRKGDVAGAKVLQKIYAKRMAGKEMAMDKIASRT